MGKKQQLQRHIRWMTLEGVTEPLPSQTLRERNQANAPVPEKPKPRRGRPPKVRTDG